MKTQAYFEKIHKQIELQLNKADYCIKLAVAWLTDYKLFEILCDKANQGIDVQLIIAYQEINLESKINYSKLTDAGGKIFWIGNGYKYEALMHNKFCIIDNKTLITGSYNWTQKAKSNHESITVIEDDYNLIFDFSEEFNRIIKKYNKDILTYIEVDWNKINMRLQTLLSLIKLEDEEDISFQVKKLKNLISGVYNDSNINKVNDIIKNCEVRQYHKVVLDIELLLKKFNQVNLYQDPEEFALKLEIKILESQINAFDNEKVELEKILSDFHRRYTLELGDLILRILELMKALSKNAKAKAEAEEDFNRYNEQFQTEKDILQFDLSDEEKKELKKNFRKATILCHPDKVNDEQKVEAEKIFIELKEAQQKNDLETVNRILKDLENGVFFSLKVDKISEKKQLIAHVNKLRKKLELIEKEINDIKNSETFIEIINIKDLDLYFEDKKMLLNKEFENCKLKSV